MVSDDLDRIISSKELLVILPYSQMNIWRMEQAGKFPRRIKLSSNRVGWSLREVEAWIEARKAERQSPPNTKYRRQIYGQGTND